MTDEELTLWIAGGLGGADRADAGAHLAACDLCRRRWAAADAEGLSEEAPAGDPAPVLAAVLRVVERRPRRSVLPLGRPAAWLAAASVLVFVGAAWWIGFGIPRKTVRRNPAATPIQGATGELRAGAGERPSYALPDGSQFDLMPASVCRFDPPLSGERYRIRLECGALLAEVERSAETFVVCSGDSEIRVVGTRFLARALRMVDLEAMDESAARSVLAVEVTEGAVDLVRGSETLRVAAGRRGIACEGKPLFLQELAARKLEEVALQWGRAWKEAGFSRSWEAVTLLAGSWEGAASWDEALADRAASPEVRQVAAAMVAVGGGVETGPALASYVAGEREETARLALLAALHRTSRQTVERLAREDPSGKVREAASRLLQKEGKGGDE